MLASKKILLLYDSTSSGKEPNKTLIKIQQWDHYHGNSGRK